MLMDLTDDKSTFVLIMAWCHQATNHYMSQCWPRLIAPYGVNGPQRVKNIFYTPINHGLAFSHNGLKSIMITVIYWYWFTHFIHRLHHFANRLRRKQQRFTCLTTSATLLLKQLCCLIRRHFGFFLSTIWNRIFSCIHWWILTPLEQRLGFPESCCRPIYAITLPIRRMEVWYYLLAMGNDRPIPFFFFESGT